MEEKKQPCEGEIIFYTTPEGVTRLEVFFKDETFWLSQRGMAELFDMDRSEITKHIGNIFISKGLQEDLVCAIFAHNAQDGKTYTSQFNNLGMIIAVGYRVNSLKATQFRIWTAHTLREFIIKGFVMGDERLKLNKRFGLGNFEELLECIREMRAGERRICRKITDIY
jgi:hypothetical protein